MACKFTLDELIERPFTPDIYTNLSEIIQTLNESDADLKSRLEERLLEFNGLVKKNDRVFYARTNPFGISRQQIFLLKELAVLRNIPICRICLHPDDQCDIHEMFMIHTKPTSVGPLKQNKTSLSYHIIEGELTIKMYDSQGEMLQTYLLRQNNWISLRLFANQYRSVHSTSSFSIFLEVASGPFQDSDTVWFNRLGNYS